MIQPKMSNEVEWISPVRKRRGVGRGGSVASSHSSSGSVMSERERRKTAVSGETRIDSDSDTDIALKIIYREGQTRTDNEKMRDVGRQS